MITLTPCGEAKQQIDAIREDFSLRYHVQEALKNEAHITLIHPFHTTIQIADKLIDKLTKVYVYLNPIDITINRYGFFKQNRVVFLKPERNMYLKDLYDITYEFINSRFPDIKLRTVKAYTAHITIGYRDLNKYDFTQAEAELKDKNENIYWTQDSVKVWKRVENNWETIAEIKLGEGGRK